MRNFNFITFLVRGMRALTAQFRIPIFYYTTSCKSIQILVFTGVCKLHLVEQKWSTLMNC